MFHDENLQCDPAVLHAFSLMDDCCGSDQYATNYRALDEARELIRMQVRLGDRGDRGVFKLKHWLHVYAVLNSEMKGRC